MTPNTIESTAPFISLSQLDTWLSRQKPVLLDEEARNRISHCRQFLEEKLQDESQVYYGINTGFGSLCNIRIPNQDVERLQLNLVRSHACGTGDEVPQEVVEIMLLLKIIGLSKGYSGVRVELIERLLFFYNQNILPVIYQLGSLGASGDLAPLAHLSLPLIGEGEVYAQGQRSDTSFILQQHQVSPLTLQAKEGLALLNGTQFSTGYGIALLLKCRRLLQQAQLIAALSIDAFNCRIEPFHDILHLIRPHGGQIQVAKRLYQLLSESPGMKVVKNNVQDPYAFRCVPQVLGATQDTLDHIEKVLLQEVNSVTDNPTIFPDEDQILSGGNFHAQPVALVLDFLAIAMAELGNIAERRVYQLISGNRGLPTFLTVHPGLQSGLMIPQYTAASIVSQNKQLCTPASIDSIPSSNGQEDHVSMAANAATKAWRVVENVERILAIEWLTAAQAMHLRRPLQTAPELEQILGEYFSKVPPIEQDRPFSIDIEQTVLFWRSHSPWKSGF